MAIRNNLGGDYYLTDDIEIPQGTEWLPLGATSPTDSDPQWFTGIFDGKGYSIKNLAISTKSRFKGLFSRLNHAEVRDLDLINVNIKGTTTVGSVSGVMMGGSIIERVSVSGNLEGDTEVGGIVGRIARNPTYTDYNIIHDCYVTAAIKATNLSTDMNTPSCAGGIAAFSHSVSGNSVAKIDIRKVYVAGSVISEQKDHIAGNAAGILAFFDNHNFVKMEEVIVLADTIGSATSNLFFSRRGYAYNELELFSKVYARNGITLNYLNSADKGPGGQIPEGVTVYHPLETYKTRKFYIDNLSWDFENVWTMEEGSLPVLKRVHGVVNHVSPTTAADNNCLLFTRRRTLVIKPLSTAITVDIFTVAGAKLYSVKNVNAETSVKLSQGTYIVQSTSRGKGFSEKVIIE
jgi:hypothetical protein